MTLSPALQNLLASPILPRGWWNQQLLLAIQQVRRRAESYQFDEVNCHARSQGLPPPGLHLPHTARSASNGRDRAGLSISHSASSRLRSSNGHLREMETA